jgi:hypothetical protein
MRMRPRSRLITGAFASIEVRGKRNKRPAYTKPGKVVIVDPSAYNLPLSAAQSEEKRA